MAHTKKQGSSNGDITLHDVMDHLHGMKKDMHGMEQRLTKKIEVNTVAIKVNQVAIRSLNTRIDDLQENIFQRLNSLEEDLTATIMDTVRIRKHVGMRLPSEG